MANPSKRGKTKPPAAQPTTQVAADKQPPAPPRPPAPPAAMPFPDPQPDWTLKQHEANISASLLGVKSYEETEYVTACYFRLARSLQLIRALHLYPNDMTFSQWCESQGIKPHYRSRAEGIGDIFSSSEEAGQFSITQALAKVAASRARKTRQVSPEKRVGKKIEHLQAVWHEANDLFAQVPDQVFASYGAMIDALAAEVTALQARVPRAGHES